METVPAPTARVSVTRAFVVLTCSSTVPPSVNGPLLAVIATLRVPATPVALTMKRPVPLPAVSGPTVSWALAMPIRVTTAPAEVVRRSSVTSATSVWPSTETVRFWPPRRSRPAGSDAQPETAWADAVVLKAMVTVPVMDTPGTATVTSTAMAPYMPAEVRVIWARSPGSPAAGCASVTSGVSPPSTSEAPRISSWVVVPFLTTTTSAVRLWPAMVSVTPVPARRT